MNGLVRGAAIILSFGIWTSDAASTTAAECTSSFVESPTAPFVAPRIMRNGKVIDNLDESTVKMNDIFGCCSTDPDDDATEKTEEPRFHPALIGKMPQMTQDESLSILEEAKAAWAGGAGHWTQMTLSERIAAIESLVLELRTNYREQLIQIIMWEIGKNVKDATAEVDRTLQFVEALIEEIKGNPEFHGQWKTIGSVRAFVKRAAIGVWLVVGPYNYPINETYATLMPLLLMGNIVILKIPAVGGLVHLLTFAALSKCLPPGTIHFISGGGRATLPHIMKTGDIDGLALIGGSNAADSLLKDHPHPHRLKVFFQLEAKNMGIFMGDLFDEADNEGALQHAVKEAITGTLSYNGQRCTALKILFVPTGKPAEMFVEKYAEAVEGMAVGLPWGTPDGQGEVIASQITPLPNVKRVKYMKDLVDDALSKGAKIVNKDGGTIVGGHESTLMVPAVLYPVTSDMKVYHEEQFGPVVPIVEYDDIQEVLDYGSTGSYGQQVAIFTSGADSTSDVANLLDVFSSVFGKININSQCGRSPDMLPFSGRRSSAMGVMSVVDALKEFSVPTVVSYKTNRDEHQEIVEERIQSSSRFLESM